MVIDDSDSASSIQTVDESSSPIASLGAHAVQSLSLDDDQDSIPAQEVSNPLDETLILPSLVDHGVSGMQQQLTRNVSPPTMIVDEHPLVGAGLKNLGNSCFVNSVLQCLTHTVALLKILCSYKNPDPCNCGNEIFCVLSELRAHITSALSTSERSSISPLTFLENLQHFGADFRHGQHEDAHEFLHAFLDRLERCCLDRSSDPDAVSSQYVNLVQRIFGGRLASGVKLALTTHFVQAVFSICLKLFDSVKHVCCFFSQVCCCYCDWFSSKYEKSIGLSLVIEDVDSLQSALASFILAEKVEMTCDKCKKKVSKMKQFLLHEVREVVTFQLKRFRNNGVNMEKIFSHVAFPLELDLKPYMTPHEPENKASTKYHLYAFVKHIGSSLASGHYCSYVRSAPMMWHKFDDQQVDRIDEDTVLSQEAYLLFYAREDILWFSNWRELQSPNSVLDPARGECSSESSCENVCKRCDDSPDVERAATCDDDSVHSRSILVSKTTGRNFPITSGGVGNHKESK